MTGDDLYSTAIHESGHAVLAELLYMDPEYVTIEPTDKFYGHLRRRFPALSATERWRELLVVCAGVEAEGVHGVYPAEDLELPDDEWTDSGRLWASLQMHSDSPGQQWEWFTLAVSQTRRILSNPAVWRSVESLAARLLEARTLDRGEAADAIRDGLRRSKWERDRFQMGNRYACPPQNWIESREEYRQMEEAVAAYAAGRAK